MQRLQEQFAALEQQRAEMIALGESIKRIKGAKGREILAHIGKGIFLRAEAACNDELVVDVGSRVFIKKDIEGTGKIIEGQIGELENAKSSLLAELLKEKSEAEGIISEIDKRRKESAKKSGEESRERKA
ncbi:prefoldin subunit alpha [Candidatus Pacearchaeota archaeon]|nr:prefoldin subunit alpha [Candidatus Pacearchaeota archaeon]